MRIKSFTGATLSEAMARVRAEMGQDAVILSVEEGKRGRNVSVRAAIEARAALAPETGFPKAGKGTEDAGLSELIEVRLRRLLREAQTGIQGSSKPVLGETLRQAMQFHGAADETSSALITRALESGHDTPVEALAAGLGQSMFFSPVPHATARPLLLCGAFGHGKSTTAARLALRAVEAGGKPVLVCLDREKAGAIPQMETYAQLLNVPCHVPKNSDALGQLLSRQKAGETWIIDTPGLDARQPGSLERLKSLRTQTKAEAILVLAAGGDPFEMTELAEAFAGSGVQRCIVTRMDMTRRLGGILNAFISTGTKEDVTLSHASHSPFISSGLRPLHPVHLARQLLVSVLPGPDTLSAPDLHARGPGHARSTSF